jgi:hypothetical protein
MSKRYTMVDFFGGVKEGALPPSFDRLTASEQRFLLDALRRSPGTKVFRNGWPDFLFVRNDKAYGVEVKSAGETLRRDQAAMFGAIEAAGVKTYVWSPEQPDTLVFWRRFHATEPRERKALRRTRRTA